MCLRPAEATIYVVLLLPRTAAAAVECLTTPKGHYAEFPDYFTVYMKMVFVIFCGVARWKHRRLSVYPSLRMKSVTGCAGAVMVMRVLVHYYPSQFIVHIT